MNLACRTWHIFICGRPLFVFFFTFIGYYTPQINLQHVVLPESPSLWVDEKRAVRVNIWNDLCTLSIARQRMLNENIPRTEWVDELFNEEKVFPTFFVFILVVTAFWTEQTALIMKLFFPQYHAFLILQSLMIMASLAADATQLAAVLIRF